MELILVRHGLAEERDEFKKKGLDDRLRPLTLKGRRKIQKISNKLRDEYSKMDLILTSPLIRAKQTAEIISHVYFETSVVEVPELSPDSPPQAFAQWLKGNAKNNKRILAVGHEPHLGVFASWILSGEKDSFISFKKGGFACFEVDNFAQIESRSVLLKSLIQPKTII